MSQQPAATTAPEPRQKTPLYRNPWIWAFVAGALMITALRPFLRHEAEPPPVLGSVPEFALVDSSGQTFGSADLRGRVYVVSFFFTRCPSICPLLMHAMRRLQDEYEAQRVGDVQLVSITVDPQHDTPEQLQEYARELGVLPERWKLLTGELAAIRALAEGGFKVPVGDPAAGPTGLMDIAHTGKLVLVDKQGRVRGYYDTDDLGLEEVFQRSRRVRKD